MNKILTFEEFKTSNDIKISWKSAAELQKLFDEHEPKLNAVDEIEAVFKKEYELYLIQQGQ